VNAISIFLAIAGTTFRALLGRRRTLLMGILALIPVLIALLYRLAGEGTVNDRMILDLLIVRTVLPLTALVFGTTALGAELDDGTGVALLTKPIPRWQIILAKIAVAGTVSAMFAAASAIVTEVLLGAADPAGTAAAYTLGVFVGAFAYATGFVALSVVTSRALIAGLAYTLLWEGWLAGILPGTRILSLREATLGIIDAVLPRTIARDGLDLTGSIVLVGIVLIGGFLIAATRLARYQVRGGD
jgi:ABC-2 type transport system permease protein